MYFFTCLHKIVTKSLSKEMAKMRGVALKDGYSTTSSILYFYPIDKKKNGVRSTSFRTEPRPPKRDRPSSIIANYFKRNTIVVTGVRSSVTLYACYDVYLFCVRHIIMLSNHANFLESLVYSPFLPT